MSVYVLDSYEAAFNLLEANALFTESEVVEPFELILDGVFKDLQIRIFGPNYHGELTGELARGIAVFQDELYRATLNILNFMGAEQGRLTAPQKELISLQVEVRENCTLINFDLGKLSKGLVSVLKNMPNRHIAITVLGLALIAGTGWIALDLGAQKIETDKVIATEQEQTKRTELAQSQETERHKLHAGNMDRLISLLANEQRQAGPLAEKAAQELVGATRNGVREISVRAVNATSVEVGQTRLDEDALSDLRKRSPRTSPDKQDLVEPCRIIRFHKGAPSKLLLSCRTYGEFSADIDEYEFPRYKLNALHGAFQDGDAINLAVTLLVSGEKIKSALVLDIQPEKELEKEVF